MSGASARTCAEALRDATLRLGEALDREDDAAVATALEEREAALARLGAHPRDAAPEPALQALLDEVRVLDARALARAEQRLAGVRAELEEIGRARGALRSLAPPDEDARFVSKRV